MSRPFIPIPQDVYRVIGPIIEYPVGQILSARVIEGNKCYGIDSKNKFHTEKFIMAHPEIFEQGPPPAFR